MPTRTKILRRWSAGLAVLLGGSRLLAQSPIGEVKVTPVSSLNQNWLLEGVQSPNGRFFVFQSPQGQAYMRYDRVTKEWALANSVTLGTQIRWSPDGRFLVFVRKPENMRGPYVWILPVDSSTGLPRGTARRISTRQGRWPAWSPDGRRIAFANQDSGRFQLVTVPFNGGDEEIVYDRPGVGADVGWSPDGKYLFAGHGPTGPSQGNANYYWIWNSWIRINIATKHVDSMPFIAPRMLGYSRDGKLVAHYNPIGSIIVISSAADGRTVKRARVPRNVVPTDWSTSSPDEISAIEHVVPSHIQRALISGGPLQSLSPIDSTPLNDVRYSADGTQIAFVRPDHGLTRLHVATADGANLRAVGMRSDVGQFRWSPSGAQIAYLIGGPRGALHVADAASGTDRELVRRKDSDPSPGPSLGWRADGLAIRYIWRPRSDDVLRREVREVMLDGHDRLLTVLSATGEPHFVNDTLLLLRKESGVDALNLRTGAVKPLYEGQMRPRNEFGISRDGAWLVFSANDKDHDVPQLVSLTTGETRRVPYTLGGELSTIFFHPDGRNLVGSACLTCATGIEKWDIVVIPMNGDPTRVLTASQATYKDHDFPAVSPDGRYVVFESEQSWNTRVVTLSLPKVP